MRTRTKQVRQQLNQEAEARNAAYALLTLEQKLARQVPGGKAAKKLLKAAADAAAKLKK
jgi:hypothetical protein